MHANNQATSLLWLGSPAQKLYTNHVKRGFDLVLIFLTAPLAIVLVSVLACINYLHGGSPFYAQQRVGKNGQMFRCWKLRTMVMNADEMLANHLANSPHARAEWQANNKLRNDPRITRFGQFLRKSSLDELPQLLNILKGDMSIVGPRPVVADELGKYGVNARHYLSMRPGLTGLWQTSGRNAISYEGRVALDVAYRQTVSLTLDMRIIFRTIGVVFARTGM